MDSENPTLEESLRRAYEAHDIARLIHLSDFEAMLMDSPDTAIKEIAKRYNRALDEAYTDDKGQNERAFVEAIAGGPFEAIPWTVYNAVGAAYPYLTRPQKDVAIGQILSILDGRNYAEVNGLRGAGHTPGIREPLLLSDICICRGLYWPGLHDEEKLWKEKSFEQVREKLIDEQGLFRTNVVTSDFLVAYALLRSDFTNFGEEYAQIANPNFLTRVLKGIVALRFARDETKEETEEGTKRLKKLLPKSLHPRIEPLRVEADWVDYKKFK